jgi:AcrR family transcriptional regulator
MRTRRKKVPDKAVFDAIVRLMMRVGPDELTLAAIADEAGLTAGALVQRFGSKRELMLAHARYAATTGDIGLPPLRSRGRSALDTLRSVIDPFVQLAATPDIALRSLAYLQRDLADPGLHAHLLRMTRSARKHYRKLVANAIGARTLRRDTSALRLARAIEAALIGSFVNWTIYRKGPAARWIRRDFDAVIEPYRLRDPRRPKT